MTTPRHECVSLSDILFATAERQKEKVYTVYTPRYDALFDIGDPPRCLGVNDCAVGEHLDSSYKSVEHNHLSG